jgi:hypothetical protein
MEPGSEPEHSGVRPLSPHGEGYCRWCHFIVGLTSDQRLVMHGRSSSLYRDEAKACAGSGTRPPKITPYASRKAAFRVKSPEAWCPVCWRMAPTTQHISGKVYARHSNPLLGGGMCANVSRRIEKDHGGERG